MENEAARIEVELAVREANAEIEHGRTLRVIETPEQKRQALESLKVLSAKHRAIDEQRKKVVRAQDDAKKAAVAVFLEPLRDLKAEIDRLRDAVGSYEQRVVAERGKAMETATAALAAGDHAAANAAIVQAFAGDDGRIDGAYNRTDWKYEVDDKLLERKLDEITALAAFTANDDPGATEKALDKIAALSRELEELAPYLQPNHTLIGAVVRDQKDKTAIPGVRAFSVIKPVVRGGVS